MKFLFNSLLLLRSIYPRKKPKPQHHGHSGVSLYTSLASCEEIAVCHDVLRIIETADPMEPALEKVVHFLTPAIVVSVIEEKKHSPKLGFRFFIWAAKRKRFRSWVSHNLIVDMLVKDGFDLYWRILDEVKICEGNEINSDAFAVLISGYWKLKKAEKAVETFGKMRAFDCKPGLFTYNLILHVMVKKDVILLALAVYNMMLKSNAEINSSTFNIMINGLCKSGNTQDALRLFDEMTERGILPSKITYTVIISGLCQAKRADDAYSLFNSMKSSGCKPDQVVYDVLLNGFYKLGRIEEAFVLFKSFKNDGYVSGMKGYSIMIDGLIRANRVEEAQARFNQLFKINVVPDRILYTIMMKGLSQAGRLKDALNLLRDMTQRGVLPDTYCYNTLIKGFCDVGLLDQARSLQLEVSKNDLFADTCTYTIIICGMCKNGLVGEARHIFDEMEKLGCYPSVMTFNSLIDGLCKAGELQEAKNMFCQMEIGRNPSLLLRLSQGAVRVHDSTSLQKKVEKLCDSGLILSAYNLLMQLANVPTIVTYNILINGLCKEGKEGNVGGAVELFKQLQLKGPSPDKITYGTLINVQMRAGHEEDAFELFEQARKNPLTIGPEIYKSLMTWCCRKRKTSLAFKVWLEYTKDIGREGDETIKLVKKHFEDGNMEMAVKLLLEINLNWRSFDPAPYNIWLVGLCQAHSTEEALRLFYILKERNVIVSGPSCVFLIDRLCYKGELDQAIDIFLYTIEKGFQLRPRICNKLLRLLLYSQEKTKDAFDLLRKMKSVEYNLDVHLYGHTKSLFHHWKTREMETIVQDKER